MVFLLSVDPPKPTYSNYSLGCSVVLRDGSLPMLKAIPSIPLALAGLANQEIGSQLGMTKLQCSPLAAL